jgi:hypothetical protein
MALRTLVKPRLVVRAVLRTALTTATALTCIRSAIEFEANSSTSSFAAHALISSVSSLHPLSWLRAT